MAINVHNSKWLPLALSSLVAVSGCCCRQFRCPAKTNARPMPVDFTAHVAKKPCVAVLAVPIANSTASSPPAGENGPKAGSCNGCEGMPYVDRALCGSPVAEVVEVCETTASPVDVPANIEIELPNPFRSKPGAKEAPLPPLTPQVAPTPSAPRESARSGASIAAHTDGPACIGENWACENGTGRNRSLSKQGNRSEVNQ